jgi:hypothetical protein
MPIARLRATIRTICLAVRTFCRGVRSIGTDVHAPSPGLDNARWSVGMPVQRERASMALWAAKRILASGRHQT